MYSAYEDEDELADISMPASRSFSLRDPTDFDDELEAPPIYYQPKRTLPVNTSQIS